MTPKPNPAIQEEPLQELMEYTAELPLEAQSLLLEIAKTMQLDSDTEHHSIQK